MSGKKPDETMLRVSVTSLQPADKEGWMTKQGGSIKTWKKRWFVLKGNKLYYFKGKTDDDAKGLIDLEADTLVRNESDNKKVNKKSANMLSIQAQGWKGRRCFYMFPDSHTEQIEWIEALRANIRKCFGMATPSTGPAGGAAGALPPGAASGAENDPRMRLQSANGCVPFLRGANSKVQEFWQIWTGSIPPAEELAPMQQITYTILTSRDMDKLSWRTSGPQNVFIQKMVDFFWNVGAPETEIDRLNDIGALINPACIGSWIDMSSRGGMDGGWFFPVETNLKLAIEAADPGEPATKVMQWAERHGVATCCAVGRDMGAAPPRQTELRVRLPGATGKQQLDVALDAFISFGFPPIPEYELALLQGALPLVTKALCLSIITSSEGFVRLGLLFSSPPADLVKVLQSSTEGSDLATFAETVGSQVTAPAIIEFQYLQKGYGYGVYKEGFDIVFHWDLGSESYH